MMNPNTGARAIRPWLLAVRLVAILAASTVLLSGCAFTTGHVNLAYEPTTEVSKAAAADSPRVRVEVTDKRPTQAVGQKINGFGIKTADIVSDSDVAATLKTAFETELHNRGFTDGAGGDLITVRLADFQNQFTLGFFSGDASASIGMEVAVKRPDGSVTYSRYVTGESKDWVELAREGNAERMLNGAMRDGVAKVFSDNAFIEALNKR